jgi:hypothetical protein
MMTQSLADITFSEADRAELAPKVEDWYRECLLQLRAADRIRKAANLPIPAAASELYAYLLPRQAAQR